MNIYLGDHFDAFVRAQVATGRYANASEVIREALRGYEDDVTKVTLLHRKIQHADAEFALGNVIVVEDVAAFVATLGLNWQPTTRTRNGRRSGPRENLSLNNHAIEDLIDADSWSRSQWSDGTEVAVMDSLFSELADLQYRPPWFTNRSDLAPDLRSVGIGHHRIYIQMPADEIKVFRILHIDEDIDLMLNLPLPGTAK